MLKNWGNVHDVTRLQLVTYNKQRQDTILRISFSSTLGQFFKRGCAQWFIRLNNQDCTDPAPIVSLVYTAERPQNMWNIAPAVISGFCKSTRSGSFGTGNVRISVHVGSCDRFWHNDAHTGRPTDVGQVTSSLLVEEYCPN